MTHVLIIGGGIAGAETALWLARGLPDARVTLVSRWPSLRLLPNLAYVPFGASSQRLDTPLHQRCSALGIEVIEHELERLDVPGHEARFCGGSTLRYDSVVLAPGVQRLPGGTALSMRTADEAMQLRRELEALAPDARASLLVTVSEENSWSPPAYEFALLLGAWRAATRRSSLEIVLATAESEPFNIFGVDASDVVQERFEHAGIELLPGFQPERLDDLDATITVEFGGLRARKIVGVAQLNDQGFYDVDGNGMLLQDVYVVGDAANLAFKAAFATSWQARRVLRALGGDPGAYGDQVGDVPIRESEYQMDLVDGTMHVRFNADTHFTEAFLHQRAHVWVSDEQPDKLEGTLVRELLLGDDYGRQVATRFRDVLATQPG